MSDSYMYSMMFSWWRYYTIANIHDQCYVPILRFGCKYQLSVSQICNCFPQKTLPFRIIKIYKLCSFSLHMLHIYNCRFSLDVLQYLLFNSETAQGNGNENKTEHSSTLYISIYCTLTMQSHITTAHSVYKTTTYWNKTNHQINMNYFQRKFLFYILRSSTEHKYISVNMTLLEDAIYLQHTTKQQSNMYFLGLMVYSIRVSH